ncbi:c-type cytochrome biogenesis protein CcmI [Tabrizicola sp.]|uniref:c-type cytochrome biogenesis protein CcmI n=1 Tax=Tabrizicola sp. TaxID=2005166 RepID=UPI002639698C|nr:c-type cytochrome biogenesis protein CcmI [Tabrizicola sp.]MDM7930397.1 c-type cytochrome biogenesis protein CcmI [Tabrizicola sp.]
MADWAGIERLMANAGFWAVALALSAVVMAVFVTALRRGRDVELAAAADLAIYKDQLAEIERDLTRGTITADEAARLRDEVGRRVLDADRARAGGTVQAGGQVASVRLSWPVVGILAALVLAGSIYGYWRIGTPGYPDMPLQARLAGLDAAIATRPTQADELARLGVSPDAAADAGLRAALADETDPDRLRDDFAARFGAGEIRAAVLTMGRLAEVVGDQMTSADHTNRAIALVAEAQGYVSPEAEDSLRAALTLDITNEVARYLVGEMFLQGGRFDQTFRFWRPLLEDGNPAAPWVVSIRERIEAVAGLAGVSYRLPEGLGLTPRPSPGAGPGAGDVAAAAEMAPEDRQAMIEGMVAQLSDRLATEGGDVEDWNRLIRSLAVLERLDEAQTIYDEAKERFAGRPAELSFLRLAAVESGLKP